MPKLPQGFTPLIDDEEVPTTSPAMLPEGFTPMENSEASPVEQLVQKQFLPEGFTPVEANTSTDMEDKTFGGELGTGIAEGIARTGALFAKAGKSQIQDIMGDKEGAKESFKEYTEALDRISSEYDKGVDWEDVDSLNKFSLFTARGLGNTIPSIAASFGGGAIGLIGTGGNPIGGIAGAGIMSMALNSPESYVNLVENSDTENPGAWAVGVGALKSGLDTIGPMALFNRAFGKFGSQKLTEKVLLESGLTQAAKRIGQEAGITALTEGVTESMQEAIDIKAADLLSNTPKEFLTPENLRRLAIAGYFGAIAGGATGTMVQAGSEAVSLKEGRTPKERQEILKEEIQDLPVKPKPIVKSKQDAVEVLQGLGLDASEFNDTEVVDAANIELSKAVEVPKITNLSQKLNEAAKNTPKDQLGLDTTQLESARTDDDFKAAFEILQPRLQKFEPVDTNRLGLYSQLGRVVDTKLPNKGTGKSYLEAINSWKEQGMFKPEEFEWSGLKEFLGDKANVTKQEVTDFLKNGGVSVIEIQTADNSLKEQYTLEGDATQGYRQFAITAHGLGNKEAFTESHMAPDLPNVVVHWRQSDKMIDGKKTAFIEEVQSDWHQTGAKEGYSNFKDHDKKIEELKVQRKDLLKKFYSFAQTPEEIRGIRHVFDILTKADLREHIARGGESVRTYQKILDNYEVLRDLQNADEKLDYLISERRFARSLGKVPDAPFKKSWSQLALKRILRKAAEEGYEQVAIPQGKTVARIQNHSDTRAAPFYEQRLMNELKQLGKRFGLTFKEGTANIFEPTSVYLDDNGGEIVSFPVNVVSISPEARSRILGEGFPLFQHFNYKYNDPLSVLTKDTEALWKDLGNQLKGIESTLTTSQIQELENELQRVSGKDLNIRFMEDLTSVGNPVRGAQLLNTIYVSLNQDFSKVSETGFHEVWHYLYDEGTGLFTENDRKVIESQLPNMIKHLSEHYGVLPEDIIPYYDSASGTSEIVATLFGLHATKQKNVQGLSSYFNKALNFIKSLGNYLRGKGFGTFESVFNKTLEGNFTPSQVAKDTEHTLRIARLQNLSNSFRDAVKKSNKDTNFAKIQDEAIAEYRRGFKMSLYARSLSTATNLAHTNPIMAILHVTRQNWEKAANALQLKFVDAGASYTKERSREVRIRAAEILDHLRNTQQAVTKNADGHLVFERDGKQVKYTDPRFVKVVESLDAMMKAPITERGNRIREVLSKYMPDALTASSVKLKIDLERNTHKLSEEDLLEVAPLVEAVLNVDKIKKNGYVHHGRIGPYAITVHLKSNYGPRGGLKAGSTPVFHAHMEEGKHLGKYHKYQYDEINKQLEQFRKNPDLYVISKPYKVTYNNLFDQLQNSVFNVEIMSSLLSSFKDSGEYAQLMQQFKDKLAVKGFARTLNESKDIPGYSKDWERTIPNFIASNAAHISRQEFYPQLERFKGKMEANLSKGIEEDKRILDQANSYLEYITNGTEEFEKFSAFNYMWTMGFNLSTAALQIVGLPTATLSNMAMYDSNVFKHMANIANNFKKVFNVFSTHNGIEVNQGTLLARFDNNSILDKLNISNNAKDFMKIFFRSGVSGSAYTEESLNQKQADTRTKTGKLHSVGTIVKNYSGLLMSTMEQLTRATTALSVYEMFEANPEALKRAQKILEKRNDQKYKVMKGLNPDMKPIDLVTLFAIDEIHAVFGKTGRGRLYRGVGRIFLPFTQYPMSINEMMFRMYRSGPEGKKALAVMLVSLMFFGGMLALPGADLAKSLFEAAYKLIEGENIDLELELREAMYDMTGSPYPGMTLTQGVPRLAGLDISSRVRQQIAGQDLLLSALGVKGGDSPAADMFGVQGSVAKSTIDAFNAWQNDDSAPQIASMLTPAAMANFWKSYTYRREGVSTRKGNTLIPPEDVTMGTLAARLIGFSSSAVASAREEQYWKNLKNKTFDPAMNRYRERGKKYLTKMVRANQKGNTEEYQKWYKEWHDLNKEVATFVRKEKMPMSVYQSFGRSVTEALPQRLKGGVPIKSYDKMFRPEAKKLSKIAGTKE